MCDKIMQISDKLVYTDIEEDIDYNIYALLEDDNMIVLKQEGYRSGSTVSYNKEEFLTKFKIKGE